MNEQEKNSIYTAEDIRQYLSGKLTPLQMHAIEKAALDDEFLAEAIEGYEGIKEESWKKGLISLQNKFATAQNEAKVIALVPRKKNTWWKIAAAVLLIATTAAISYIVINKKDNREIAQKTGLEKINAPADPLRETASVPETVTPGAKTEQTDFKTQQLSDSKKDNAVLSYQKNNTAADTRSDSAFVYTAPPVQIGKETVKQSAGRMEEDIAQNKPAATAAAPQVNYFNSIEKKTSELNTVANNNGVINNSYDKSKEVLGYSSAFKKEQPLTQKFSAQVVGLDNTPLPYANISIKSENFGTYADVKGNFNLVSTDSSLTVEVKAAGYQPRFYTLQSFAQQNKIVLLEEDATARYKTVTGNVASGDFAKTRVSRKATLLKDSVVNVEPADGWDNYNTYVNNNIDIPDDILQKNIHGQVELSFDVRSNGTITNIKVDKSLCDNCDELAKRLIEQGPQWKVKKGKKRKGKVTVQF
jgi:hypothetical protein